MAPRSTVTDRPYDAAMADTSRLYFRQILAGMDIAEHDPIAQQMVNFVYLIGDRETGEAVVVGLGVTGVGVALDAISRGMSVLAIDAHDLAFGTSRWSSKLVHGGLRYLAHGQIGVAHESAVERGVLMETTAPHLTKPLGNLVPLSKRTPMLMRGALLAGDLLRRSAGTSSELLPPGHFIPVERLSRWLRGCVVRDCAEPC